MRMQDDGMTALRRAAAVMAGLVSFALLFSAVACLRVGTSPVRDRLAAVAFVVAALLGARSTWWLWRIGSLSADRRVVSELAAFGSFVALMPVVAMIEPRVDVFGKDVVHVSMLVLVIGMYVVMRRPRAAKSVDGAR